MILAAKRLLLDADFRRLSKFCLDRSTFRNFQDYGKGESICQSTGIRRFPNGGQLHIGNPRSR